MDLTFPQGALDAYIARWGGNLTYPKPFEFDGGWVVELHHGNIPAQRLVIEPDGSISAFLPTVPMTVTLTQWTRRRESARRPRR